MFFLSEKRVKRQKKLVISLSSTLQIKYSTQHTFFARSYARSETQVIWETHLVPSLRNKIFGIKENPKIRKEAAILRALTRR